MQILKLWFANAMQNFQKDKMQGRSKDRVTHPFTAETASWTLNYNFTPFRLQHKYGLYLNDIRRRDRISTTKVVAQLILLSFQDKNPVV